MDKLVNIVTVEVRRGNVDKVLNALVAHKERSLREPGVLQFEVLRPQGDDSTLMVYEVYESEAAFEDHRAASSLAQLLDEIRGQVAGLKGVRCAVADQRAEEPMP